MGDFRFKFGVARGPEGNFQARTDNLFASTDATPDVTQGSLFYTNNASATSISYFDLSGQNAVAAHQGKEITILCLDANTTFVDGTNLRLRESQNILAPPGSVWEFVHVNSTWYESYRSANTAQFIQALSGNLGTTGLLTITPFTTAVTLLTGASSSMTLRGMPGGINGQRVTLSVIGSSVTVITNSVGATDSFIVRTVGGTSAIITGSGSITFVRVVAGTTAKWHEVSAISATSG